MNMSPVFLQRLKQTVERVLHVPGNFTEPPLEMALVLDGNLSKAVVMEAVPELLRTLKMHSEVFRNVRLNVVDWQADDKIGNRVAPMSMVMLSSFYEDYIQCKESKHFENLIGYLKMYQARAKLVILLTDGTYQVEHEEVLERVMQPFLDKKMIQVVLQDEEMQLRYRFVRTI